MNLGKENETIEFKKSTGERKQAIVSIVAMLNKSGKGHLYFGVDDNGDVVGQQIGKNTLRDIANEIGQNISPRIFPEVKEEVSDDGITYVSVSFDGNETPYSTDGRFYIRVADQDRVADTIALRKLLVAGSFDALREKDAYQKQLSFSTLFATLSGLGKHPENNESYYDNIGLLTSEGRFNYQAELLSDQSKVSLKVSQFYGRDKDVQSARSDFGGKPLFVGMNEASSYISSLCETKVVVRAKELERVNTPLFDIEAFREAWVNAVVHNSWMELGEPAIYIFDDRIEVTSFGGLPIRLDLDDFYLGKSLPVNPSLFKLFAYLKLVEENGHGVRRIVSSYGREAIAVNSNFVTVTIPFAFTPSFAYHDVFRKAKNEAQKAVIKQITLDPEVSYQTMAKNTGFTIYVIRTACEKLQENRVIAREGGKKGGKWVILS